MSIAFVKGTESGVDQGTPIVLVPAAAGNLLVYAGLTRNGSASDPIGFTSIGAASPQVTPSDSIRLAYRIAQAGDSGSWRLSAGGADPAFMAEFSGVQLVAPVDVAAGAGSIPTQLVSVSLSPTAGGSRLVVAGIEISDNGAGNLDNNITPGAGYTLATIVTPNAAGHPLGTMIYRIIPLSTGADVAPNATGSGGLPAGNAIIAASFLPALGSPLFAGEPGGGVW